MNVFFNALFVFVFLCFDAQAGKVRPGIERLGEKQFAGLLAGKRLGVVAHNASRDSMGRHLVDILLKEGPGDVKKIFSPEHGFRGVGDSDIADHVDPSTGLPVISLYGPRKAPSPAHLKDLDALVIDLQDVGIRFYTYSTTMALAMKAAKKAGIKVVVLDRPNPIGADVVDGAVLEESLTGNFEAFYPVATRHGMTMGELALLYNNEMGIEASLEVVPVSGWKRQMRWPATGLKWIAPSPALPTYDQSELYALLGALETYPLAVGRGKSNKNAFRTFGAPWITKEAAKNLVRELQELNLQGLSFGYTEWTPDRRERAGRLCRGFKVEIQGPPVGKGLEVFLPVAQAIRKTFLKLGRQEKFGGKRSARALGADWLAQGVADLGDVEVLLEKARESAEEFKKSRKKHLLY